MLFPPQAVSATGEKKRDESTGEEEWQNERELEEKSDTEERDESEIKEPPLPPLQSPPHTSQEAHSTAHVQQPQQYFAEGEQAKQELAQILIEAFYRCLIPIQWKLIDCYRISRGLL